MAHDIRGDAKHLNSVTKGKGYVTYLPGGPFNDHILCDEHEAALGPSDDYAVSFCRGFESLAVEGLAASFSRYENPRPDLLQKFIHSVVWRRAADLIQRDQSHWLGSYYSRIEDVCFRDAAPLEAFVIRSNRVRNGERQLMAVYPFPAKFISARATVFELGGFTFILKTSSTPLLRDHDVYSAHQKILYIPSLPEVDIRHDPMIRRISEAAIAQKRSR